MGGGRRFLLPQAVSAVPPPTLERARRGCHEDPHEGLAVIRPRRTARFSAPSPLRFLLVAAGRGPLTRAMTGR